MLKISRHHRQRELAEALTASIDAVSDGSSTVDECLARHPRLARELEPLLRTTEQMAVLARVAPPEQARLHARYALMQAAGARSRPVPIAPRAAVRRRSWLALAPAAVAAVLFAAVAIPVTSGMNSGAMPGDWNYSFKRATERVRLALATDPSERDLLHIEFASRRLAEIERVSSHGQADSHAGELAALIKDYTSDVREVANTVQAQGVTQDTTRQQLESVKDKADQVLQPIVTSAPDDKPVKQAAQDAVNVTNKTADIVASVPSTTRPASATSAAATRTPPALASGQSAASTRTDTPNATPTAAGTPERPGATSAAGGTPAASSTASPVAAASDVPSTATPAGTPTATSTGAATPTTAPSSVAAEASAAVAGGTSTLTPASTPASPPAALSAPASAVATLAPPATSTPTAVPTRTAPVLPAITPTPAQPAATATLPPATPERPSTAASAAAPSATAAAQPAEPAASASPAVVRTIVPGTPRAATQPVATPATTAAPTAVPRTPVQAPPIAVATRAASVAGGLLVVGETADSISYRWTGATTSLDQIAATLGASVVRIDYLAADGTSRSWYPGTVAPVIGPNALITVKLRSLSPPVSNR